MDKGVEYISYDKTGSFSKLMIDYANGDEKLTPFFSYPASLQGVEQAIEGRKSFKTNRQLLVDELRKQYEGIDLTQKQDDNLTSLLNDNTYTVCTAHQPVIFTGPLYTIYKIIHAIKLADTLSQQLSKHKFVPVFYMGSEDADLDELGQIHINGEKLIWETKQTGAVGRMKVDKALLKMIERLEGELAITESGKQLTSLFKQAYTEGSTIQQATLILLNELFKDFGLLVLIPDNSALKAEFASVVKRELTEQFSHSLVEETSKRLGEHYKQQAVGRDINLFYLTSDKRARIEKENDRFVVVDTGLSFSPEEMSAEVDAHPDRFSGNVILRPLFQETILPNVVFIGGGAEVAYWLELKAVFESADVPYPALLVRNSFMLLNSKEREQLQKLGFDKIDLCKSKDELINTLVARDSDKQLTLATEKDQLNAFYQSLQQTAGAIDTTLADHTAALQKLSLQKIDALEKKMLRAEKRKFDAEQRQITKLKEQLFPKDSLQERVENFSSFYAAYGTDLFRLIYDASLSLEQKFCIASLD